MKKIWRFLLVSCLGGLIALGLNRFLEDTPKEQTTQAETQSVRFVNMPVSPAMGAVDDFTHAAEMSVNAVVHVKTEYAVDQYYDPFLNFFGRPQQSQRPARSAGSGVIVSGNGFIVTNHHVIKGAQKVEVSLNNNKTYQAEIIGSDPSTDLAVLKIEEDKLPYMVYGNSDQLKVGEWVLAVGNPFNLTSTVTAGIVSAKARSINLLRYDPNHDVFPIESFIQTDAAVNPGNSGGALVNRSGQLVGINTAIASNTGAYTGYSFAVPVGIVKKVIDDLVEFGEVKRAYIGVSIRNLNQDLAAELGIDEVQGVYVNGLTRDGAAAEAGIKEGDIITKINEVKVNNVPALQEQVGKFRPGDRVKVTLKRNKKLKEFAVVLRSREGHTEIIEEESLPQLSLYGAKLESPTDREKERLRISGGAKISTLNDGKLRNTGIREGFIITKIDKQAIKKPKDVDTILANKQGGVLIEGVYPNGVRAYYGFGI